MTEAFFKSWCQTLPISVARAKKVIDARYKPYLSALDDQYYDGSDVWDARVNALMAYMRKHGETALKRKLFEL